MHKILLIFAATASLVSGFSIMASPVEARKVLSTGKVNGPVILACSPRLNESWRTYHATRDRNFFSQRVYLSGGEYIISASGRFRFNSNVWTGENKKYVTGQRNTNRFSTRVKVSSWDTSRMFLFQARKINFACAGCSMTMSVKAVNCPGRSKPSSRPTAPACKPNYCDTGKGLFGAPSCVYKRGARGGLCGTPGN